jgi:ankyrin repeat protein
MLNRSLTLNFEEAVERELWYAASRNEHRLVKKLLKLYAADLTYVNHGMSCLHVAAFRGNAKTVEMLLDYGTNVDLSTRGLYGQTALHLACAVNSLPTI